MSSQFADRSGGARLRWCCRILQHIGAGVRMVAVSCLISALPGHILSAQGAQNLFAPPTGYLTCRVLPPEVGVRPLTSIEFREQATGTDGIVRDMLVSFAGDGRPVSLILHALFQRADVADNGVLVSVVLDSLAGGTFGRTSPEKGPVGYRIVGVRPLEPAEVEDARQLAHLLWERRCGRRLGNSSGFHHRWTNRLFLMDRTLGSAR